MEFLPGLGNSLVTLFLRDGPLIEDDLPNGETPVFTPPGLASFVREPLASTWVLFAGYFLFSKECESNFSGSDFRA